MPQATGIIPHFRFVAGKGGTHNLAAPHQEEHAAWAVRRIPAYRHME
jgi:hypothetical protein